MTKRLMSKQKKRLKVPRGAMLRAIVAGNISAKEAHERGYMTKTELLRRFKSYRIVLGGTAS